MNKSAFAAPRCPGTLKEGFSTYCPAIIRSLFEGKQVFHVLKSPFSENVWSQARISHDIYSGQQEFGLRLEKNQLVPDINGLFLLKTAFAGGSTLRFHMEQPGNEHFCLQLAQQAYGIETVANALIFFPDGQPALICRKLSILNEFSSLESLHQALVPKAINSYNQLAAIIDLRCAASVIAKERFFSQVIYSWLIANGKADAKNFGLIKTSRGDYSIAPLFAAACTRLHEMGPELPLADGLFVGDKSTPEYRENGNYTRNEFVAFGSRIGLMPQRVEKIINRFVAGKEQALELINRAFLPDDAKAIIRFNILERGNRPALITSNHFIRQATVYS